MNRLFQKSIILVMAGSLLTSTAINPKAIAEVKDNKTSDVVNIKNERQELIGKRSEYSKTYINSNGTLTTDISPTPIHYFDENIEKWKPINNVLKENNTSIYNNAHSFHVKLDKQHTSEDNLLEISENNYEINLTPMKEESVTNTTYSEIETAIDAEVSNNTIIYPEVFENADLKYSLGNDRIKEEIILKDKPANLETPVIYTFSLDLGNLTYKQRENGSILLLDKESGDIKYYIEAPIMYDSFKPNGYKENEEISTIPEEAISYDIKYDLRSENNQLYIDLIPNQEWLLSDKRVYPVTLDPTIVKYQPQYALSDTNIRSAFPKQTAPTETTLGVGLYKDATQDNIIRSLIRFDTSSIPQGANVLTADLNLWLASVSNDTGMNVTLHSISTPWTEYSASWMYSDAGTQWNSQGGDFNASQVSTAYVDTLTSLDFNYKWSLTPYMMEKWINNPDSNLGFLLKSSSETTNTYKKFISGDDTANTKNTPLLSVTYTSASRLGLEDYWTFDGISLGEGTSNVNLGTGNNVIQYTDYNLDSRGDTALVFGRTYNSKSVELTPFGYGWVYNGYESIYDAYKTGNVLYTEPDGTSHYFKYDQSTKKYISPPGKYLTLTKVTDQNKGTTGYTITDKNGYITHFDTVNIDNELSVVTARISYEQDLYGNKLEYKYSTDGKLTGIVDATGRELVFTYTTSGLVDYAMLEGQKTDYNYDINKRLVSVDQYSTDGTYNRTKYGYSPEGYLTTVIDPNNRRTDFTYENEYVAKVQEPSTDVSGVDGLERPGKSYQFAGRTSYVADALGNVTEYHMDSNYTPTSIVYADGTEEQVEYDTNYNPEIFIDSTGKKYIQKYDSYGNVLEKTDEENRTTKYTYNSLNFVSTETDPSGNVITYAYNDKGKVDTITDSKGQVTKHTYDQYGNLKTVDKPDGSMDSYSYNAVGNEVLTTTDGNGNITISVTDKQGNELSKTDGKGNTSYYEYNQQNELVKVTDANKQVTTYDYDNNRNLLRTTYPNGSVEVNTYNGTGQILSSTDALGNTTNNKYDSNGNLIETKTPNGRIFTYVYNELNQLVATKENDNVLYSYTYDPNGNLETINDDEKVIKYTDSGSIDSEIDRGSSKKYLYFENGEVKSLTYSVNAIDSVINYNYDEFDRLTDLYFNNTKIISYGYDTADDLKNITLGNGATTKTEYDKAKNLTGYANYRSDGTAINEYNYTYDQNNLIKSVTASTGTVEYEYNNLSQLISETLTDGTKIEYSYDFTGNRDTKKVTKGSDVTTNELTFNKVNQISTFNGTAFEYDRNGNLVKDNQNVYVYNVFDQLTEIKDTDNVTIFSARYDNNGKRISTETKNKKRNYFYQDDKVIYETDESGNIVIEYIWDESDVPVAFIFEGQTYYYHLNGHGDVVSLTDNSGNIVASYDYDAWGNIISQSGELADVNPYRYAGYRYDDETGLYLLSARYYDPDLAVFLTMDSHSGDSASPINQNKYSYSDNNPVNLVDHDGDNPFSIIQVTFILVKIGVKYYLKKQAPKKLAKQATYTARRVSKSKSKNYNFRNMKFANAHKHHLNEFGAKKLSLGAYSTKANKFFKAKNGRNVLKKSRANGDRLYYNPKTNEFGVLDRKGHIRTYYKPKAGMKYWRNQ
ncbi:DNRLRE domain-containing protein (plasmid) [Paenibacillus urinalis]|uniref:DNRLRE domain-containing protein n=1 Tax=Paenibacillus urinalis TaxID=521520 RepID=A0ABY7XHW7_9BACL|nr:DNRLRE domain-containing protein [Paenibacillus urinalis]WDH95127.1 DNRLRE domain-containing protein [Paenibacillus urinalis]WDI05401.1 DNRLRE domain-containing protein [Paenibacillus urinalis]